MAGLFATRSFLSQKCVLLTRAEESSKSSPIMQSISTSDHQESDAKFYREPSNAPTNVSNSRQTQWWKIRLFRGMLNDVKRRAPFYWSDWKDAWDYRVVPATLYMYFAKYALRFFSCS